MPGGPVAPEDPRTRLAGERTLLAWIRTGLAMMGFGFVVARFGLFLRELAAVGSVAGARHTQYSLWIGTALILLGVVVNLVAAWEHFHFIRRIDRREAYVAPRWSLSVVVAIVMSLVGLGMAAYLVFLRA